MFGKIRAKNSDEQRSTTASEFEYLMNRAAEFGDKVYCTKAIESENAEFHGDNFVIEITNCKFDWSWLASNLIEIMWIFEDLEKRGELMKWSEIPIGEKFDNASEQVKNDLITWAEEFEAFWKNLKDKSDPPGITLEVFARERILEKYRSRTEEKRLQLEKANGTYFSNCITLEDKEKRAKFLVEFYEYFEEKELLEYWRGVLRGINAAKEALK